MSYQRKVYPRLDRPRTRWDLTVEKPQAGTTLGAFLMSRVSMCATEGDMAALLEAGRVTVTPGPIAPPKPRPRGGRGGDGAVVADVVAAHDSSASGESAGDAAASPAGEGGGLAADADKGGVPSATDVLGHRARVVIELPPPEGLPNPLDVPISALLDDGVLYAIAKQPGVPVQPRGGNDMVNVLAALHARHRTDDPTTDRVPHLAHRIDVDTSGVLLLLWDAKLSARVMRQFSTREVKKEYLAIVHGAPAEDTGAVDTPLVADHNAPDGQLMYRPGAEGKDAVTEFEIVERLGAFSLVRFRPMQGRTHQIRLHALWMGHPLLCDKTYGGGVAFTAAELTALAVSDPPVRLPLPVGESGDVDGRLRDLLPSDPDALASLSPLMAAAAPNRRPLRDVLGSARVGGVGGLVVAKRCMLHANVLELRHPATGEPTRIEAPVPDDMEAVLAVLRAAVAAPDGAAAAAAAAGGGLAATAKSRGDKGDGRP